jgi:hypothetical protein
MGIVVLTVLSLGIEMVKNPLMMGFFPDSLPTEAALNHSVPVKMFVFVYTIFCVEVGGYVTRTSGPHLTALTAKRTQSSVGLPMRIDAAPGIQRFDTERNPVILILTMCRTARATVTWMRLSTFE